MGFSIKEGINKVVDSASNLAKDLNRATTSPRQQSINTTRRTFNANKYKIDQLSYPIDLMSPQYGGNYAVFYINVADDSRLNVKENTVELDPSTESRMRGSLVAKNLSVAGLAGSVAGLTILEGAAGGIKNGVGGAAAGVKNAIPEAGINALGVAVAGTLAPNASRSQRRLKTAIALHVPNQLSVRYGTMWSEVDTAAIQAVADAGGALAEAISNPANMKKALASGGSVVKEAAANLALTKMPNAGAVSAALGIAANPKKEQTFQGVEFRKFTFDYQFFPRDEFEAENVLNIIHQFKLHMHPEFKSELNYVWIYPSEFDIIYYTNGGENLNVHRHTSCILENMTVNYTPNGSFSVFANGMPTQISVSLDFKELQLASKETIGDTPGGL
jgi:hypothetical protein